MADVFGQDIRLSEDFQALVAANGELVLSEGAETGEQDVRLRLFTRLGSLFYDTEFGSLIHDWIKAENTLSARLGFEAEVVRRLNADPRIQVGTAACSIVDWDETGITAAASWTFIEDDHPYNLVIKVGTDKLEGVIVDVNPRE